MQCRKAKPVPEEFEDFIRRSGENAFIMFSLGSLAQSQYLPKSSVKELLEMFSRLKQNVIWKFERELDEKLPVNVKITKWLPQQDLLGHPKIRLFITHGGMLGLQESVYHGVPVVPVVAIPLFAEQPGNVARVEEIGIGVKLDFPNISGASMNEAISRVLDDKSYADNAKKYSTILRDFVENQVEKAAYWVEYIIRHNGAEHLKIIAVDELNFFQYFLLDVFLFILFIFGVLSFTFVKIAQRIVNKFF